MNLVIGVEEAVLESKNDIYNVPSMTFWHRWRGREMSRGVLAADWSLGGRLNQSQAGRGREGSAGLDN